MLAANHHHAKIYDDQLYGFLRNSIEL